MRDHINTLFSADSTRLIVHAACITAFKPPPQQKASC